jgi:hypothetical protein
MSEYGWSNKGNSEISPSDDVGDEVSDAFAWPENAIDYIHEWSELCNNCCAAIMPIGVPGGQMLVGMRWDIRQWMQGYALPAFYNERSHFQSRGDSYRLQGVGKAWCFSLSSQHGRSGSELFFDQVEDQLSDFLTDDKEEIFKYITFIRKGTRISNYAVWRFTW